MPKTVTVKTTAENAYGKAIKDFGVNDADGKLIESVPYSFKFEELLDGDEIPAKENPEPKDLRKMVSNKRKASARTKALNAALDAVGIKAPEVGVDMEYTWKQLTAMLIKSGKDEDVAKQMANQNLGTDFTDY